MVDMMRKTTHSKTPVSLGTYRNLYKKDYLWGEEPRNEEQVQKLLTADAQLRAKEFAVPWERRAMPHGGNVLLQRREAMPEPSIRASSCADDARGRKPGGRASGPTDLQQRDFTSASLTAERCPPKYYAATELAATQARKSERLEALPELKNKLPYCQHLPAAAKSSGTAGTLLSRQKLVPNWVNYPRFARETSQATMHNAQRNRNRNKMLGSSVVMEEYFDLNQTSIYKTDFQHQPGPYGGHGRPNKTLSHIFPKDDVLHWNHWESEYKDNYSIFLQRQNRSSGIPAAGLY